MSEKRLQFFSKNISFRQFLNSLTKRELSALQSYRSYYGHYKRCDDEIEELEAKIKKLKKRRREHSKKLTQRNQTIDFLRDTFSFSASISSYIKDKKFFGTKRYNEYWILTLRCSKERRKALTLGTKEKLIEVCMNYYQDDAEAISKIQKNVISFLTLELNERYDGSSSQIRTILMKRLIKNRGQFNNIKWNRDLIFKKTL
tara:strand:- start:352 stop:954 length:603 start_codon:yes stop_codon:yes gene_type:complete